MLLVLDNFQLDLHHKRDCLEKSKDKGNVMGKKGLLTKDLGLKIHPLYQKDICQEI